MAIDEQLFRVYEEAFQKTHPSKSDLAKALAAKKLTEFSQVRQGERHYFTWSTIQAYVSLLVDYEILTPELGPTIAAPRVSRTGFNLTLADRVEAYAVKNGFSPERIRDAVRELIQRKPASLPTPQTVCTVLQLQVGYNAFHKALSVRAFQQRVSITPKLKNVIIIPDILRE